MSTQVTSSYLQDQKHSKVSAKFNVIQASAVGEVMLSHGLRVASLKTGKARLVENSDHQSTITRYRSDIEIAPRVFLDIVHRSFHVGRGSDTFTVALFREICTNGLGVSKDFFSESVRHSGDTFLTLDSAIRSALNTQTKLAETVLKMQNTILTPQQKEELAFQAAKLLVPEKATRFRHNLLKQHRASDADQSLWVAYNTAQENAMQGRIAYSLPSIDAQGRTTQRDMTVRAIRPNSVKDLDFNQALFDVALKFVA